MRRALVCICGGLAVALQGAAGQQSDVAPGVRSAGVADGANCLATTMASNNGGSNGGTVYFDLTIGPNDLTFDEIYLNTNAEAGAGVMITVYTLDPGISFAGNELTGNWHQVSTGTGVSAGPNNPTFIQLDTPFTLMANTTQGVAINLFHTGTATGGHAYTNGTGSNQVYSNADLTLTAGSATNGLFGPSVFTPRVFNGWLFYDGGTAGCSNPPPPPPPCTAVEIFAMTVPSSQIEMDNLPLGPVTVGALNAAGVPGPAALSDVLMPDKPTAAAGVYNTNSTLGNALARVNGAPMIIEGASGTAPFDATTFEFVLDHEHTEFGFEVGDWVGPMIVRLYKGTELQAMVTTGTASAVPQFVQIESGCTFDRVAVDTSTTAGNFVITQIWTEESAGGCYPDCTGDQVLDLFDFLCFTNAFNSGDPYADCTGDQMLDLFDFLCFTNAFNAGCP